MALAGFPVALRWAALVDAGVLRRPHITIATVADEHAKEAYVKQLVRNRKGRTLIFCDWIEQGQALADALDVPFVHGSTARKLQVVEESEVCVVSRVADRGLSLGDLRLAIEVAGHGSAREQFAQRVGRLLHGQFEGEWVTVFTPDEASKYRGRIYGVEAELAGEVDLEFITVGKVADVAPATPKRARRKPRATADGSTVKAADLNRKLQDLANLDPIDQVLQAAPVAARIGQVKKNVGSRTERYVERVMRYCWDVALSSTEIAEGLAITDKATRARLNSACNACVAEGLMLQDEEKRYRVNREELDRLVALGKLRNK